jgi:hypothetical protein
LEEKQAVLEAVLASRTFARSEKLRAFLRFVCEREMAGQTSGLTEYAIGTKALGRPADFSPLEDSSVRTGAYELRGRLRKYYSDENPNSPVRIELLKGAYTPRFVVDPSAAPAEPHPAPRPFVPAETRPPRRLHPALGWAGGFLTGCLVALLAAWAVIGRIQGPGVEPALKRAWAPIVSLDEEILLCIGAPLHLQVTP